MDTLGCTTMHHGMKRRAQDDQRDDHRLAKRLNLLNLEQNGKLYVSVPGSREGYGQYSSSNNVGNDSMQLDDTKNKVYIHNLDEQIAEIEDEERMVFLPDIEKKLGKIPHYVLTGDLRPTAENQLVLYGVPASLSMPEEKDNVRKAIIESRARAREKQLLHDQAAKAANDQTRTEIRESTENGIAIGPGKPEPEEDGDAMDIG